MGLGALAPWGGGTTHEVLASPPKDQSWGPDSIVLRLGPEDGQNGRYEILVSPPKASPNLAGDGCTRTRPLRVRARHQIFTVRPVGERGEPAIKSIVVEEWIAFTVAGSSRLRASTPGSRSTASGSSAEPGLHQRARARRRTLLRPGTLAGDSSPDPRRPQTRIDHSY